MIRINKYLSESGICSRRAADKLIEEGKVTVNGITADLGTRVSEDDLVELDGKAVKPVKKKVVLAYNKPTGIECTADRKNKDNIIDAVNYSERVVNIGRLDKNSCGLILLTNDGELANIIMTAGVTHDKEYFVKVNGTVTDKFIKKMEAGVRLDDGVLTRPCKVFRQSDNSFNIILTQGLNRQIRRMCLALGLRVVFLKRIRIMTIKLGNIKPGEYRILTDLEVKSLYDRA
ncbi:MAG: pseudouridine synthase [Lachnospiraceae bacterium]|nr:pseudouridine synthase [Lachnospiraceae bacterium]